MSTCPECGKGGYQRLSQHIAIGSCDYAEISDYKKELMVGMLLGDGCIGERKGKKPYFVVGMINKPFLEWLSSELGWVAYDVRKSQTPEQSAESARKGLPHSTGDAESFSAVYRFQTLKHPWFTNLAEWYSSGKKRFPKDLELTPLITKMWYVCDGGLRKREPNSNVSITSRNESDRGDYLVSLFEEQGFNPRYDSQSIVFTVEESKQFLDWIGDPVPGFEYKWEDIEVGGFTPWQDKETLEYLYLERDLSLKKTGNLLGCSDGTISTWLRKYNLPVKSQGGKLPL